MNAEPTERGLRAAADRIGAGLAEIRAVIRVEASGRFFDGPGLPPLRFEPHHIEAEHWSLIGFAPAGRTPWRASLALRKAERESMRLAARRVVGEEAMLIACSMGGPQIMGFNHALCGYASASAMYRAFSDSADAQIEALAAFVDNRGAASALRSHDWRAFATAYNGSGNVDDYAAKLEAAYRAETGERSPRVLRLGSQGDDVATLQEYLRRAGVVTGPADGTFGPQTERAVRAFQEGQGITVDGVVGFNTWRLLKKWGGDAAPPVPVQPVPADMRASEREDAVAPVVGAVVGTGGLSGVLGALDGDAQTIAVAALAVAALGAGLIYAAPYMRRAWRRPV